MKRCLFVLIVVFCMGISRPGACNPRTSIPFNAVATIFPWTSLLKGICKDRCRVHCLLPPGASPHTWSPVPKDIKKVKVARLFVYSGKTLEPWAEDFIKGLGNGPRIMDMERLYRKKMGKVQDPHIWMDFRFDLQAVDTLLDEVSRIDPDGVMFYAENARALKRRLKNLDAAYRKGLMHCKYKTVVIAGHNAFSNIQKAYGLKIVSVVGMSPDAHITPRNLGDVISLVKERGIPVIFYDHAVTDRIAKTISRETGARIAELTPGAILLRKDIESGTDFIDLMYRNLNVLTQGLFCTTRR